MSYDNSITTIKKSSLFHMEHLILHVGQVYKSGSKSYWSGRQTSQSGSSTVLPDSMETVPD